MVQTGAWSAIGFPVEDAAARDRFYKTAGWLYQAGVFVSRSSGLLYQVMPAMLARVSAWPCLHARTSAGIQSRRLAACTACCIWGSKCTEIHGPATRGVCALLVAADGNGAPCWQASRAVLWIMPGMQLALLIFFSLDAWWHFWYNAGLYIVCFIVGAHLLQHHQQSGIHEWQCPSVPLAAGVHMLPGAIVQQQCWSWRSMLCSKIMLSLQLH